MIKLYINYWHGEFFVGTFRNYETAEKYYENHKGSFRDYAGEKHGFPYGTPIYVKMEEKI